MIESLERLKLEALESINNCSNETELNNVKSKYIGKKSEFTEIMAGMSKLSNEEKKEVGMKSNEFRTAVNEAINLLLLKMKL